MWLKKYDMSTCVWRLPERILLVQSSYFSPLESKCEKKKTWRDRKRQMELRIIENDAAPGECANADINISLQPLRQQFYP